MNSCNRGDWGREQLDPSQFITGSRTRLALPPLRFTFYPPCAIITAERLVCDDRIACDCEKESSDLEHLAPRWEVYPPVSPVEIKRIQSALPDLRLSPLVVQLLANRDLREADEIRRFLEPPDVSDFPDPLLMIGMKPALERICRAIDAHEKVVVYGDFDADGVTSTALLAITLGCYGALVEPYVPHRVAEGYGLHLAAL